uniref:Ankyrin repeat and death domain-containing protein 1B isoform X3 n=1 Tax=Geotrypetes seraphini TaxID=260995 RepID=A0A6P8PMK2_GEOSA|nr:ankyrin repeat and death domain-containing protein 1B isoform X3 [Geotrypetes seraphini]
MKGLSHIKGVSNLKGLMQTPKEKDSENNHEILLQNETDFQNAAKMNDVTTMTMLFEKNVKINAKNNLKRTALHFAVAGNHLAAVEFLLSRKAQVNVADKHGLTPLHLAAWSADLNIMVMLIKAGVNQKATNEDGMNVLHFAAQNNKGDIVNYLLQDLHLMDLNKCDKKGKKPFHLAAENGHIQTVKNLISLKLFTLERDKEGNTALHLAAKNGRNEVVETLINLWDDINEQNENGETPFYLAVEGGHEDCAVLLLEAGSDIDRLNKDGTNALHIAAQNGYVSIVKFLISKNIDLAVSGQKDTPLHLAIRNHHMDIVEILSETQFDINTLNQMQQTALHLAAELRNIELVEKLLKQGKTALAVASRSNHTLIVDMIIKAERYYTWKQEPTEKNEDTEKEIVLTFKQDHSPQTSQIRSALWNLAYNQLKEQEWKVLAHLWQFSELQIKAIEEQWTGKKSYQEHGNRMLLIWLHGVLLAHENPIRQLYKDLVHTGHPQLAESFRAECTNDVVSKKCIVC